MTNMLVVLPWYVEGASSKKIAGATANVLEPDTPAH